MTQPAPVSPESSRGISRRTLVTATAWSAPVIGLSIASPAASASDPIPFAAIPDVRSGSTFLWFDGDSPETKTSYNLYPELSIPALSNVGSTPTPAGLLFTWVWDNRVFDAYTFTSAEFFDPEDSDVPAVPLGSSEITFLGSTAGTNRFTTVFSINIPIPVGRAIRFIGSRPNIPGLTTDLVTYGNLVPLRYEVGAPSGYSNAESGVIVTTPELLPYNRWDFEATAVFTPSNVDDCSVPLPDYLEVEALGPFPIPIGTRFQVAVDANVVTAVADAVATFDGSTAPGFFATDGGFTGSVIFRSFRTTAEVPVGSVLRFTTPLTIAPSRFPGQNVSASNLTISSNDPNLGAGQLTHQSDAMTCPLP